LVWVRAHHSFQSRYAAIAKQAKPNDMTATTKDKTVIAIFWFAFIIIPSNPDIQQPSP
jgi:hypothetical protein